MRPSILFAAAALGAGIVGVTLYQWGQPPICTCGEVKLWVGSVFSPENSQHIADWYTLSHIVHGMLVVLLGRWLFPRAGIWPLLAVAVVTGVAWELIEHTDFVLNRFRDTTLYRDYLGDTVLNAVCDYLWMMGGFAVAWAVGSRWTLVLIAGLEILAAAIGRDSLALTTLMLVHPVEAIEQWQQELNPNAVPAGH